MQMDVDGGFVVEGDLEAVVRGAEAAESGVGRPADAVEQDDQLAVVLQVGVEVAVPGPIAIEGSDVETDVEVVDPGQRGGDGDRVCEADFFAAIGNRGTGGEFEDDLALEGEDGERGSNEPAFHGQGGNEVQLQGTAWGSRR